MTALTSKERNHGFMGYRSGRWEGYHFALYALANPGQWISEGPSTYPRVRFNKFGGFAEFLIDQSPYHDKYATHSTVGGVARYVTYLLTRGT